MKLLPKLSQHTGPLLFLALIVCTFFYKTVLFGKIPFPGDLLLSEYAPWRHVSYNGYVAGSIPSKGQYFDVIRELYPWKTLVNVQLRQGKFPLWNPYNFSGAPLLANYQSQALYPLTFLYAIFPQRFAWTMLIILQPIIGMIFLYFFAIEIGLSRSAAVISSILFNFSSFANVWMEFNTVWHTILWIPLLLFILERGIKQKKLHIHQQCILVIGLYSSITAGHPQDTIYSFAFVYSYTIFRLFHEKTWGTKSKLLFFFHPITFLMAISFLLASPQLLPTINLFRDSARVTHDYQNIIGTMLIQWWQIPLLVVQDFWGNPATKTNMINEYIGKTLSVGITGFFLAVTALHCRNTAWHKKYFITISLIMLLLTVNTPITQLLYSYPIPILSTGTPTRVLFLLMMSLSILAGYGIETLKNNYSKPYTSLLVVWIMLLGLWIFAIIRPSISGLTYMQSAFITMKNSLLIATSILSGATVLIYALRLQKYSYVGLILLAVAELFLSFTKFNPFVPKEFVFPDNKLIEFIKNNAGIHRSWGYGTARIEANFATQVQIYSPDGTDPLNLKWYNQLMLASSDGNLGRIFDRTTRSDAQILPGYGETDLPTNEYRLRLLDVLGVKYVIDRNENPKNNETFNNKRFTIAWHEDDWTVYENRLTSPRMFLTNDVRSYTNIETFENQFFSDSFVPGKTVLLDTESMNTLPKLSDTDGSIALVSYEPETIALSVETEKPQLLYISDTFDEGWVAKVNGRITPILKANYAFRAVLVPTGASTVIMTYKPMSFRLGIYLAIAAILIFTFNCLLNSYPFRRGTQKIKGQLNIK